MKKIIFLILLMFYIMGVVSGVGYAIHDGNWVIACSSVVLAAFGFGTAKNIWNILAN